MTEGEVFNISEERWLRGSVKRIKEVLYKHPVHPIGEARYFRHFLWRTGFSPSVEHLSPISYFLSLFGIEENITRRRATEFHFQHSH